MRPPLAAMPPIVGHAPPDEPTPAVAAAARPSVVAPAVAVGAPVGCVGVRCTRSRGPVHDAVFFSGLGRCGVVPSPPLPAELLADARRSNALASAAPARARPPAESASPAASASSLTTARLNDVDESARPTMPPGPEDCTRLCPRLRERPSDGRSPAPNSITADTDRRRERTPSWFAQAIVAADFVEGSIGGCGRGRPDIAPPVPASTGLGVSSSLQTGLRTRVTPTSERPGTCGAGGCVLTAGPAGDVRSAASGDGGPK
mmetsp:Transcript_46/g.156  ORF Transcript_46/g.156 Transcript_46/m.156 type:complete len:260 (+) Transcript_46:364-1143(+)